MGRIFCTVARHDGYRLLRITATLSGTVTQRRPLTACGDRGHPPSADVGRGAYRLRFSDLRGEYVDAAWGGGGTVGEGADLVLVEGQSLSGLDVELAPVRVEPPAVKPAKVTVRHQWQSRKMTRKGATVVPIAKATSSKLKLTRTLRGRKVRVRVTVSAPGHRTTVFTTAWTRKVA